MDETNARHAALEIAIREAPGGTKWAEVIDLAKTFAEFIIDGQVPASQNTAPDNEDAKVK